MKIPPKIIFPKHAISVIFITVILLQSCGFFLSKNIPNSRQDADHCYKEGLSSLNSGSFVQAEICFKNALGKVNPYAPALEGMAQLNFRQNQINEAKRYLEAALEADNNWLPAYILKGRILLLEEDYDLALEELHRAEILSHTHHLLLMQKTIQPFLADAYAGTGNFKQALFYYRQALLQNPGEAELQQKISAAEHGQLLLQGKGNAVRKIILKKTVSRADLAVLLVQYLDADIVADTLLNAIIRDLPTETVQAQAVQKTVRSKLLPLLPDGTFHPSDRVDRAEAALFMEQIFKQHFPGFQKADAGHFKDVEFWQPYSRAAVLVVSLNLISAGKDGYFFPKRHLSGREAVEMVYRLAKFLQLPSFPANLLWNKSHNAEHN